MADPAARRCYELGVCAQVVKRVECGDFTEAAKEIDVFWVLLNQLPLGLHPIGRELPAR